MPGPMRILSQAVRRFWTGKTDKSATSDYPDVIVHDPAAQAPHDLDDPFFERDAQTRMAGVIASAVQADKKQ